MTIDEAIKHYERQTEELYKAIPCDGCPIDKCKEEHRQLAEWLRELKIHREIHEVLLQTLVDCDLDICCDNLMDDAEEKKICEEDCNNKSMNCWVRWAKLKAREVNADADSD